MRNWRSRGDQRADQRGRTTEHETVDGPAELLVLDLHGPPGRQARVPTVTASSSRVPATYDTSSVGPRTD